MAGGQRVLLVISTLAAGGAERALVEIARGLSERGMTVGVMTLSGGLDDHYVLPMAVERIRLDIMQDSVSVLHSLKNNIWRSRILRHAIRGYAPDVVISFVDQTNVRVLAALLGTGVPVVACERIDPRRHRIGAAWEFARRLSYRFAIRLVVQTASVAVWARALVPADRVRVMPNFVRDLPLPPAPEQRNPGLILAVGRLNRQKGFDVLLRAFAASGLMAHGASLCILGEGPERAALQSLSQRLGIDSVVSMPGVVKAPEDWMERCGIYVLPSLYEGFPNALLEAMAMGCAVVASDCPSSPSEMIEHGGNGLLVAPGDVDSLADALTNLWGDQALRTRIGRVAAQSVRERYAKDKVMDMWLDLVREVTGS